MSLLDYLRSLGYPDENELFFDPAQFHSCGEVRLCAPEPPDLPASSPRPDFHSNCHRSPGGFPEMVEK